MKILVQTLTLTSFVSLLSAFVLYRGGYFNAHLSSPNGGAPVKKETPIAKDSTKKKKKTKLVVLESSKSGRMIEVEDTDSIDALDTNKLNRLRIMNSSKSGEIFAPVDTTKPRKKRILSGTKSAPIFEPLPVDTLPKNKKKKKTPKN